MKRIAFILFILLQVGNSFSQSKEEIKESILKECNCPSREIDTDSVYSFLNSAPLEDIGYNQYIYVLKSNPIPICELKNKPGFRFFLELVPHIVYAEEPSLREHYKKERERLISLFASILDTSTNFIQPISGWDLSRFPKGWILSNQRELYDIITATDTQYNPTIKINKKKKNEQHAFEDGVRYARECSYRKILDISMSIPVFDKDYTYALIFVSNNNSAYEHANAFILYQRDPEKGWKVYAAGNGSQFDLRILDGKILLRY